MQELRLVLIIVGGLAIAALLFHGLWTSKKEGKSKLSEKSTDNDSLFGAASTYLDDDVSEPRIVKREPTFGAERELAYDPLGVDDPLGPVDSEETFAKRKSELDDEDIPHVRVLDDIDDPLEEKVIFADGDESIILKPKKQSDSVAKVEVTTAVEPETKFENGADNEDDHGEKAEDELEVIIIHVHCAGDEPFVGTKLFDSMSQNGLFYGDMDIFHRHNDMSGTGKVLFSVANMMQPGTLQHDDPATFTTKGISFFMTLPCFGDAEQNFKLMLRTAQQIADDLSANVLDDQRNLITPDKLSSYRNQIREFKARHAQ